MVGAPAFRRPQLRVPLLEVQGDQVEQRRLVAGMLLELVLGVLDRAKPLPPDRRRAVRPSASRRPPPEPLLPIPNDEADGEQQREAAEDDLDRPGGGEDCGDREAPWQTSRVAPGWLARRVGRFGARRPKNRARMRLPSKRRINGTIEISIVTGSVPGKSIATTAMTMTA